MTGTVTDANGVLQLGITEAEVAGSDGSANVELSVSFTAPSGQIGKLVAPMIGLAPVVSTTGGRLAGGENYFYAVSAVDDSAGESALSFIAQAATRAGSETNSIVIDGIVLPAGAVSFHVYRGPTPELLFRIATCFYGHGIGGADRASTGSAIRSR